eukprot:TRINITY_DN63547_c0_g2_i1.p1 TRINITY_DN63547_c0_g2~~TRINITY_DN63547_c0_g2_i1.p1  ORF type:complete len:273 (+),score=17.11 TRINITY_DN63547_c0_g2_i1:51-869(+)
MAVAKLPAIHLRGHAEDFAEFSVWNLLPEQIIPQTSAADSSSVAASKRHQDNDFPESGDSFELELLKNKLHKSLTRMNTFAAATTQQLLAPKSSKKVSKRSDLYRAKRLDTSLNSPGTPGTPGTPATGVSAVSFRLSPLAKAPASPLLLRATQSQVPSNLGIPKVEFSDAISEGSSMVSYAKTGITMATAVTADTDKTNKSTNHQPAGLGIALGFALGNIAVGLVIAPGSEIGSALGSITSMFRSCLLDEQPSSPTASSPALSPAQSSHQRF